MTMMPSFLRAAGICFLLAGLGGTDPAAAQDAPVGDAGRGNAFFQAACAVCHTTTLGPGNTVIVKQGPSLVGVTGRPAGTGLGFNYTKALAGSGFTWDAATLDKFLTSPVTAVPGTTMPIPVPDAGVRRDLIAYLATF